MKTGIYKILNRKTNKFYIGSTINIEQRVSTHKRDLKNNNHHNIKLQRSWNKQKGFGFKFIILEYCTSEKLLIREQYYIDNLKPFYNISKSSSAPMMGRKHSKKTRNKMLGKTPWNRGIPRTQVEKKLMSKNRKAAFKTMDPKVKATWVFKLKQTVGHWKGKKLPKEIKYKISLYWRTTMKKIECSNGQVFETQLQASKLLNVKQGHISEVLNGKRSCINGLKFKYQGKDWPKYKSSLLKIKDNKGNTFNKLMDAVNKYNLVYPTVNSQIRKTGKYINGTLKLTLIK